MPSPPAANASARPASGVTSLVELVRLAVVVLATAAAFSSAALVPRIDGLADSRDSATLLVTVLGAAVGYVGGGMVGRFAVGRIDAAERRLHAVSSGELLAGLLGGLSGLALAAVLTWPVLLLPGKLYTVPLAAIAVLVLTATGLRVGAARGGDLLRYLGASGRLPAGSPSAGPRAKIVDTSALIDGRLVDVCRGGFVEATLVVPRFVLYELQAMADAGDAERRSRGRRGLDVLAALQRSAGVALEVAERDYPDLQAVDAKLVAMAKERGAGLLTVDGNLARVAEVQGVKVGNLHGLAEALRPPVLPGELLRVQVLKAGTEPGQGVGYLSDGTMVVVEGAMQRQGTEVAAEVTSILSNPNGRMVFATLAESARLAARRATPVDQQPGRG